MFDFLVGYWIGSNSNVNNKSDNYENPIIVILFMVVLAFYMILVFIAGYEFGKSIKDINLTRWGFAVIFIYVGFKYVGVFGFIFRPLINSIKSKFLHDISIVFILFCAASLIMFIMLNMDMFNDNKLLTLVYEKYVKFFSSIYSWLLR